MALTNERISLTSPSPLLVISNSTYYEPYCTKYFTPKDFKQVRADKLPTNHFRNNVENYYYMMSNGIRKAELQQARGTRPIVQEIDSLRICLGNDNVIVQTPKVEINLRSAKIPPKEMRLKCLLCKLNGIKIDFSYPIGFPSRPLAVTVECSDDKKMEMAVQAYAINVSLQHSEQDLFPSSIVIIEKILAEFMSSEQTDSELFNSGTSEEASESKIITNEIIDVSQAEEVPPQDETMYTCRVCRSRLFDSKQLHDHTKSTLASQPGKVSSIYLTDPPSNLVSAAALNENSGKILCNSCGHKLGHWSWTGGKCSCCDVWVAPLFQFVTSKVDTKFVQSSTIVHVVSSGNDLS